MDAVIFLENACVHVEADALTNTKPRDSELMKIEKTRNREEKEKKKIVQRKKTRFSSQTMKQK